MGMCFKMCACYALYRNKQKWLDNFFLCGEIIVSLIICCTIFSDKPLHTCIFYKLFSMLFCLFLFIFIQYYFNINIIIIIFFLLIRSILYFHEFFSFVERTLRKKKLLIYLYGNQKFIFKWYWSIKLWKNEKIIEFHFSANEFCTEFFFPQWVTCYTLSFVRFMNKRLVKL